VALQTRSCAADSGSFACGPWLSQPCTGDWCSAVQTTASAHFEQLSSGDVRVAVAGVVAMHTPSLHVDALVSSVPLAPAGFALTNSCFRAGLKPTWSGSLTSYQESRGVILARF
jgi:hypothetical protein